MSTLSVVYNGAASIFNQWLTDSSKTYAVFDYTDGSSHQFGVPISGATGIPSTATISSVNASYSMVAANLGVSFVTVGLYGRSGGVYGASTPVNVFNDAADNFTGYGGVLGGPGGTWTPTLLDSSYLCAGNGSAADDGSGNHRTRWRIVDAGVNYLTALVTFTLATPLADSGAVTDITVTSATLNGHVDPKGANSTYPASYKFEYGLTAAYGNVTPTQTLTGSVNTAVSAGITGLVGSTTYHWRLVAFNADGTSNGTDGTFLTASTDKALFIF